MKNSRAWQWSAYATLALLIMLPLLKPGYIFGLDMVFAPTLAMPATVSSSYLLYALLHVLNFVLPAMLIQKLLLTAILVTASLSMHRLITYAQPPTAKPGLWQRGAYFGGILYVCNQFTYTRFMVGQYEVLLGYALLPLFILFVWKLFDHPGIKIALYVAAITTAISVVSIHTLGMAILAATALLILYAWRQRHNIAWLKKTGICLVMVFILALVASSYWLVPLLRGDSATSQSIAGFTTSDVTAFQTSPGSLGLVGNVLALQGFWGDNYNLYVLPSDILTFWWLPLVALWALVATGIVWSWRHSAKHAALLFGSLLVAGLVLAAGTAGTIFAPLNNWLHGHLSLFAGYREPQKFAALIALAYAYFGAAGIYWLAVHIRSSKNQKFLAASLLLPFACAPLFIWGGARQLQTNDYPQGWYAVNKKLGELNAAQDKTLFLPWHLYMPYHFSNGVIASPAARFFTETTILSSRNPELKNAHSYTTNADIQALDTHILPQAAQNNHLAADLAKRGIRYIIVTKDFDFSTYRYLDNKPGIRLLVENADIKAYAIAKGGAQ